MLTGYLGRMIDVDLSAMQVKVVNLERKLIRNFIGGLGVGAKILYDEVGPNIDPLSRDNIIVIMTGPLSGTDAPANGRTETITKSPLSGIIGRGNFGGWWGPRVKHAGFEGIVVRGKADSPVYLWIDDGRIEVRSAQGLWGKDTWETTDTLRGELGSDISVLSIGQAGENLVKFACPVADYHHAPGRSHAGCVMGDKKLKAIAIRGTGKVPVAHETRFKEAIREAFDRITSFPEKGLRILTGSNYLTLNAAKSGAGAGKNFQTGFLPFDSEIWNMPETMQRHLVVKEGSYGYHCPYSKNYGCDLVAVVREGPYAGLELGGVSFSYPSSQWGVKCGIKDFPAMWKCRELCNRYGMDQTTPIPFAMELYEKGIITKEDTDGLELGWGNEKAIHKLIGKIAKREGLGDALAEGSKSAAKAIGKGAEKYAMTMKGVEIMSNDPRTSPWSLILGSLTSLRGGDDLDTTHSVLYDVMPGWAKEDGWSEEKYLKWLIDWVAMPSEVKRDIFGDKPKTNFLNPNNYEGRVALVKWHGDYTSVYNSLGLCMFPTNYSLALGPSHFAELYSACTGWEISSSEIMKVGERIFNLMKSYGVREGLSREHDLGPDRFYKDPWPTGPLKGNVGSKKIIRKLLEEYYELRGWDKTKGVPTKRKLYEIGLDFAADELFRLGLIPN